MSVRYFEGTERVVKEKILQEINMSEEGLDESVETIKSWLQHQPHLPQNIDSSAIKAFIVGCRSVEPAKDKLQEYFMARINLPREMSSRIPRKIAWENLQPMAFLPDLTPEGYLVLMMDMPDLTKTPGFNFLETTRFLAMMTEVIIRERPYISGHVCIIDFKNTSIKLVPKLSVTAISNALYIFDHAFPIVMKAIYTFNTPQIANWIQRTLLKPIMSKRLYNMIQSYCQDEKILEKHIPIEILPREYGGKAPLLKDIMRDWRITLENSNELFSEELVILPDVSKMPKKLSKKSKFGSIES